MSVKLFVGGLSWGTDDRSLRQRFEEYGTVEDAVVIRDRDTANKSLVEHLVNFARLFKTFFLFCLG
ncbi:12877_t:CDS:2 [Funneliformis caledonium]|uniref:12877_t:CDS:1 n=1 Tax=Funneliformis caledonium TaxID=1117310 RepID=A0A9N9G9N4_9GLOM|nr:12877_t:CDS:2 [Funneliformis caledonium]